MSIRVQVTFDALDPRRLGAFYAALLGYVEQPPPEGFADWPAFLASIGIPPGERDSSYAIIDPDGVGPRIYFQRVPEPKTSKNRCHLDVNVSGGASSQPGGATQSGAEVVRAAARRAVLAGATENATFDRGVEFWIVMTDPEGNEFCLQ